MKAVAKTRPGPGLEVIDIDRPRPLPHEVLLRVKACGACINDIFLYQGKGIFTEMLESSLPAIIGHEFCGEIVELGIQVTGYSIGDRVVGEPTIACGECYLCKAGKSNICENSVNLCKNIPGGMAEYVAVPSKGIHKVPPGIADVDASFAESISVGTHALERMPVLPGEPAAILGPGPIGLLLMQAVKAAGAYPVIMIGTSRSPRRLQTAKELGADEVAVADQGNLAQRIKELTGNRGVPRVFEAAGAGKAVIDALAIASKGGQICLVGAAEEPVVMKYYSMLRVRELDLISSRGRTPKNWDTALNLMASGKVRTGALTEFRLPLSDAIKGFQRMTENRDILKLILEP